MKMTPFTAVVVMALATACRGDSEDTDVAQTDAVTFPTPWEGLDSSNKSIRGAFLAQIAHDHPGAGWFESGPVVGRDVVQVDVLEVGAAWPVVQIRILGHTADGWNELEIDVALNKFVAGNIPFDGESAVGQLFDSSDGSLRYLIDGELIITQPGIEDGQTVEGEFKGVSLSEKM